MNLLLDAAAKVAPGHGPALRRTWRALGLRPIDDAGIEGKGRVNLRLQQSRTPALHVFTADVADYLHDKIFQQECYPGHVIQLGDIADVVDSIRTQKESFEGVPGIENIPDYDPAAESWTAEPIDTRGQIIAAMAAMATASLEERRAVWENIANLVGGAGPMNIAVAALADEIQAAVANVSEPPI